jgi:alkanesulfonate monooxygenase SsuD/methylene tetrahydromethanopterin reductase-like flavin-dependent oxidoreductase (luciferase family)
MISLKEGSSSQGVILSVGLFFVWSIEPGVRMTLHFAIEVVPFGEFADPRLFARLAHAAEDSGWEGLFLWDHLAYVFGFAGMDPWIALSAAAAVTQTIKLGVDVSPLPRYRPHVLAQTLTTLDHLSQGRVVLGAGLGGSLEEFSVFGEPADPRHRGAMLDEGLQVLDSLLRGETLDHRGQFYTAKGVTLTPLPVQQPRPPFWIGGDSHAALRRAARWDGWVIPANDMEGKMVLAPDELAARVEFIHKNREQTEPFEVAIGGCSQVGEIELPLSYAEAGATWWLETLFGLRGSPAQMLRRVEAGPSK